MSDVKFYLEDSGRIVGQVGDFVESAEFDPELGFRSFEDDHDGVPEDARLLVALPETREAGVNWEGLDRVTTDGRPWVLEGSDTIESLTRDADYQAKKLAAHLYFRDLLIAREAEAAKAKAEAEAEKAAAEEARLEELADVYVAARERVAKAKGFSFYAGDRANMKAGIAAIIEAVEAK
ncbi:hypothetical protein SEA_SEPHIROTH_58 [Gordonia Phage Sephiroth]|uniref:Uncharacterized protein n=1 Tax=Gordonia Phage Sephiroth TaxID=2767553 RepID=A0A7G9UZE5_9CAUD|nr:hypothetical protein L3Y23_gp058 [Gordonia Phage Sephiroth]QNN99400.1 hypothetical protein SEA_SEPHIROTH_58 [Gordonia Phage Sephiroth]